MNAAINEWLKEHKPGEGWEPIASGMSFVKGKPIVILQNKNDEYPYSVQYAGNGRYFKTYDEATKYVAERFNTWVIISAADLERII